MSKIFLILFLFHFLYVILSLRIFKFQIFLSLGNFFLLLNKKPKKKHKNNFNYLVILRIDKVGQDMR